MSRGAMIEQTIPAMDHPAATRILRPIVRGGGFVFYTPFGDRGVISGVPPHSWFVERVRLDRRRVTDFVVRYGKPEPGGGFTVDADAIPSLLTLSQHIVLTLRRRGPMAADDIAGLLDYRHQRVVKAQITRLRNEGVLGVDDEGVTALRA